MTENDSMLIEKGTTSSNFRQPSSKLDAFHDVEVQSDNNFLVRDYNFENEVEEDLERQIDFDFNDVDSEKFCNELLFHVQGLGSVREINGLSIYVKGPHCEDSLKDLIKICKRDDVDNPAARTQLGKWHILQNDILPLLITQAQDKQLSFYIMIFLVQLTESPTQNSLSRAETTEILQDYKVAFLTNEVLNTILVHLADCLHKDTAQRNKMHDQMIELIMTLFRNLLRVPDLERCNNISEEVRQNLQVLFFKVLHKEQAFEAFVYLAQDMSSQVSKNMNLVFLEVFYHIFSAFEPAWIMKTDADSKSLIERVREKEELLKRRRRSELSSRHARFDCNIKISRHIDGTSKIVHNPFLTRVDDFSYPGQLKKPKSRKTDKKNSSIFSKSLDKEVLINDLIRQGELEGDVNLKQMIKTFALDFLEHAFNTLMEVCYDEIYHDSVRVDDADRIHYFIVTGFCLEMNRLRFAQDLKAKNKVASGDLNPILEFDMQAIGSVLQITHFELLYSILVKEVTKERKRTFNVRIFHAALYAFLQLLKTVKQMSIAPSQIIRRAAQILTQNIFYHDVSKILRIGFNYLNPEVHEPKLTQNLIGLVGVFFDMLEEYAKGKVMTIQTEKKLKIKKKKKKITKAQKKSAKSQKPQDGDDPESAAPFVEEEHKPYASEALEGDMQTKKDQDPTKEDALDGEDEDDIEDDEDEEEEQEQFKERKFNLASEFAVLVDYNVVTKMLNAISGDKLQNNPEQINQSVTQFINRIVNLLKADWIFFQIDYLFIFQEILRSNLPRVLISNQMLVSLIQVITKNYFTLLKKNKLLGAESLFRFSDRFIKDEILNNYEHPEIEQEEVLEDGADRPGDYGILAERDQDYERIDTEYQRNNKWTQYADSLLIKYYESYKEMSKPEEHLCLLLHSFGASNFESKDVRRRVKQLKLHKSKEKAEELFRELYCNSEKVSMEEALKTVFINITNRSFSTEDFKSYINGVLDRYLEYKSEICQSDQETFLDANDYTIVPLEMKDFDILEWHFTEQVLLALNFRGPKQGEIYWRIPGLIRSSHAEVAKDEFNRCFESVMSKPELQYETQPASERPQIRSTASAEEDDVIDTNLSDKMEEEKSDHEIPFEAHQPEPGTMPQTTQGEQTEAQSPFSKPQTQSDQNSELDMHKDSNSQIDDEDHKQAADTSLPNPADQSTIQDTAPYEA